MARDSDLPQPPTLVGGPLPFAGALPSQCISLLIYHSSGTRVLTLAEGQRLTIGRDPMAELTLNDQALSRRHACFELQDGEVWVEDLGSTNGTRVNGAAVTRARLGVGDEATLGGAVASIHRLPSADDRMLGLDSHDQFVALLEHEVARGRTFGRPLALVMLRAEGIGRLVEPLRRHLRPVDRVAKYSDEVLEILRPEVAAEPARQLATQLQATLREVEVEAAAGLVVYPDSATSAEALLTACRDAVRRARPGQAPVLAAAEPHSWEPEEEGKVEGLVVRSAAMREVFDTVERVARSLIPVLICGDTGTGKEVLARLIHQSGPRKGRRMASINCGAIPATLVESVLFGHEKGAFTGATQSSKGLFEEADGGTVFLDEVGELSASAQVALLRVLETKVLTRVGSNREIAVDVRVIAATNRELEVMCNEERFRWDLYYRLNAMMLKIPPLRERPEEIAPLAELFMREANQANERSIGLVDPEAMRLLHDYAWPGNVRELRNAIERAVVIARSDRVTVQDLPQAVRQLAGAKPRPAEPTSKAAAAEGRAARAPVDTVEEDARDLDGADYREQMQRQEAKLILSALRRANWNRAEAAKTLNLPLRTLSHKIKQLGIKRQGYGLTDED
jgi:transcriptional regulator with GAF, ATPase, and Fis domain